VLSGIKTTPSIEKPMSTPPSLRIRIFTAVAMLLNLISVLGLIGIATGAYMAISFGVFSNDDHFFLIGFCLVFLAIVFTANYLIFGSAGIWNKLPARDKLQDDAA
jgi:hypothetical protein